MTNKTGISKAFVRAFFSFGIKALNKKRRKGDFDIKGMRAKTNAPGDRRVLVEIKKPKFYKGYYMDNEKGIIELDTKDLDQFNFKIVIYDGSILFDFIRGWCWYYNRQLKKWEKGSFGIIDAWGNREVDIEGIRQEFWIGDVNWISGVWKTIIDEIRGKLSDNPLLKRMIK